MGSGLILLVIVAAWLAVLVPMALRTHESSTSLSSVDRFSDAMRVLSRRDAVARARARAEADDDPLSAEAFADNDDWDDEDWDGDELEGVGWRERLGGWRDRAVSVVPGVSARPAGSRRASTPAARRRRLLLALVLLTGACLAGGAFGPRFLLGVGAGLAVVVLLFLFQLRRLAVQRAGRRGTATRPAAPRPAPQQAPVRRREPVAVPAARSGSVRVQPASVHEPLVAAASDEPFDVVAVEAAAQPYVAPVPEPAYVAAPAVRHDEPLPAARRTRVVSPPAALGEPWSPVPLPPPTYVTAPTAPARAPRIVDLTRPGAWSQAEVARAAEELPGSAPKPEPSGDRRRAVNDW